MIRDKLQRAVERELVELETAERPRLLAVIGAADGWDAADVADRIICGHALARLDARIDHLRNRLVALESRRAGGHPVDQVTVEVDFGDGPETYLLGDFPYGGLPAITPDGGLPVITPKSPLGQALAGARIRQVVTYRAPRGPVTVVLLAINGVDGCAA